MANPVRVVSEWAKTRPAVTNQVGKLIAPVLTGTYPAIRLADVGPVQRGPEEKLHRVQIECWADGYDEAHRIAQAVDDEVEAGTLRGTWTYVDDGTEVSVWCSGGAVDVGPFSQPDLQTQRNRFLLDIVLWLYPAPS